MQNAPKSGVTILPRLLRVKDAPRYCGMHREIFNRDIRPSLMEIPIGVQGKAFDRLEIDRVLDEYMQRNGRRPVSEGETTWDGSQVKASGFVGKRGISRSKSTASSFAKVLEQARSMKQKKSSQSGCVKSGKRSASG